MVAHGNATEIDILSDDEGYRFCKSRHWLYSGLLRHLEETDLEFPLATRICLAEEIAKYGWSIGEHSYGAPLVFDHEYGHLMIGRFCSIAIGVSLLLGNHRTDLVSTFPFKVLADYWPGAEHGLSDHEDGGDIAIGSDVWLGAHSTIVPGVEVGSGAVVAANAVVTKRVPPYAIVGGNPARLLRYRCTEPQIEGLLKIAWWDWSNEKVQAEIGSLTTLSVDDFIARHLPEATPSA